MAEIISIGTDLHKISRFLNILKRNGPLTAFKTRRFSERILNPTHELPTFKKYMLANKTEDCARMLSVSWSVKEAIYKTLDDEDQRKFVMKDWYKINDDRGRPLIGNSTHQSIKENEVFLCTISHDGDLVNSFVLRKHI